MEDNFYRDSYRVLLTFFQNVRAAYKNKDKSVIVEDINLSLQTTWDKLGEIEEKYDGA
jgi:hypothetical protein